MKCNRCGKEAKNDWSDITPIDIEFGYGSDHDMNKWHVSLCDKCLEEIVKDFVEPPTIDEWI